MRGYHESRRDWLTFGEAMDLLAGEGMVVTAYEFRRETKRVGLPLVRKYGHYRYTPAHVEAVRAFARREGLVTWRTTDG
jgi:hypothetical protein